MIAVFCDRLQSGRCREPACRIGASVNSRSGVVDKLMPATSFPAVAGAAGIGDAAGRQIRRNPEIFCNICGSSLKVGPELF